MNFDVGNILTHAGQISWRQKSIWGLLILPMLASFLPLILFLVLFLAFIWAAEADVPGIIYAILGIVFLLLVVVSTATNFMIGAVFNSAATLGIIRANRGEGSTRFMDLLRDGTPYFWRIFGVTLVLNLIIMLGYVVFSLLALVLTLLTFGLASICIQPLTILLIPVIYLVMGIHEAALVSVVNGNMNVKDAIKHALHLVRAHVWKFIIISLIVYFGSSILGSIIFMPLMVPAFFLPILFELGKDVSMVGAALVFAFFFCIFMLIMILVSSALGVFVKTALDLTCLRLTQNDENQV
jgi:hypothetical protein